MRYINLLKSKAEQLEDTIEDIEQALQELLCYVESDKFSKDPYVNKTDIILRVHEIKQMIFEKTDI
jgi:hypothetical protein